MSEYIVKFHHDERGIVKAWDEVGELIRCKDCYFYEKNTGALKGTGNCWYMNAKGFFRNDDDFCSRAEKE